MEMATKVCPACGKRFSYEVGRGKGRTYCKDKSCYNKRKIKQHKERLKHYDNCKIEDCESPAVRVSYSLCEKHYSRLRRNGHCKKKAPKYRYITDAGYIELKEPSHPLSGKDGRVYEHRKILYDKYGSGVQQCFWCGKELKWENVAVDHLDEKKENNKISNLVISCNDCNRARGAILPFIEKLSNRSLKIFINRIKHHHDRKTVKSDGGFGNKLA